jgi:protein SCO1
MVVMPRWRCTLLALLLALGAHCAPALADGDPASDFLLEQQVFLSSLYARSATPSQQPLLNAVRAANKQGFQIRVAIITDSYDLGAVTKLWRQPHAYARFLGVELSFSYKGRLLVVMPNGFGFNWPGHPDAADEQVLRGIPIRPGEAGEVDGATAAVRALAAAAAVSVPVASYARSGGGPGGALVAAVALALALAVCLGLLRTPIRVRMAAFRARTRERLSEYRIRAWRVYALAALAGVVVAAAAVTVIAGLPGRSAAHTSTAQSAEASEPAVAWPARQRPAPAFDLTDQDGERISPSAYRGRPVIITFIDPFCRNLCPLEAHVLNQLDRSLPSAQRPEIIAVSVDQWADTRADLLQDYSKWDLVPQWRWAVGVPSQLKAVWKRYGVEVDVETKRIAGTTVHYIGHDEMAYLLDPSGYERALFVWPFNPAEVERTLRQISS